MNLAEWSKTCHVGDTFVYDGKRIKCVEGHDYRKCAFFKKDCIDKNISCMKYERDDKQNVHYKEVNE